MITHPELDGPTMLETKEGLRFEAPPEPVDLRLHLRDTALDPEEGEPPRYQSCFGTWLWERWRATLEPAGTERETFMDIVAGYRREVWLWILGDRTWEQMLSGLAGRVSRRLSVA